MARQHGLGLFGHYPTFARAGDPKYADPLTMPPSNVAIKADADATLAGAGCLFTGPTSITLNSTGHDDRGEPVHEVAGDAEQLPAGHEHPAAVERRDLRAERPVVLDRPELHRELHHVDAAGRHGDGAAPARLPAEVRHLRSTGA